MYGSLFNLYVTRACFWQTILARSKNGPGIEKWVDKHTSKPASSTASFWTGSTYIHLLHTAPSSCYIHGEENARARITCTCAGVPGKRDIKFSTCVEDGAVLKSPDKKEGDNFCRSRKKCNITSRFKNRPWSMVAFWARIYFIILFLGSRSALFIGTGDGFSFRLFPIRNL